MSYKTGAEIDGGASNAVTALREHLSSSAQYEVFADVDVAPGRSWTHEILKKFILADAIIAFVTKRYSSSPWCAIEQDIANARSAMSGKSFIHLPIDAGGAMNHITRRLRPLKINDGQLDRWGRPETEMIVAALSRTWGQVSSGSSQ